MSSKAYIEASRLETENCRKAIENLYMQGINHDGHSWNTFEDIDDCLAVVIEEVYRKGMEDAHEELVDNTIESIEEIKKWYEKLYNDEDRYDVQICIVIEDFNKLIGELKGAEE